MSETNLHETTDASVWAAEFCKRWPSALCQIPGSEGVQDGDDWEATMIGWFANAMCAASDAERRALTPASPAPDPQEDQTESPPDEQ